MKPLSIAVIFMLNLVACAAPQPQQDLVRQQALQANLQTVAKPYFDETFVAPSAIFPRYKKIIISELDLTQVKIIGPASRQAFDHPWILTDEDKRYYQARFAEAAQKKLLDSGLFAAAEKGADDTLLLKAKITEIAPRASKDDARSRPALMDVYSEGFGRMTLVFELYDSTDNQLLMLAADEDDLGRFWELNNRVQNNMRIRQAFDYWLGDLQRELNRAMKRQ